MPCVLIIDDNASVLQALEFYFQYEGFEVLLAPGGAAGLALAAEKSVDVIMLDIEMPRMSGLEACAALKQNPALSAIPVVMMTGRHTRDLVTRGLAAGATHVLGKPFDLDGLRQLIAELLSPAAAVAPASGSPAMPEVEYGKADE